MSNTQKTLTETPVDYQLCHQQANSGPPSSCHQGLSVPTYQRSENNKHCDILYIMKCSWSIAYYTFATSPTSHYNCCFHTNISCLKPFFPESSIIYENLHFSHTYICCCWKKNFSKMVTLQEKKKKHILLLM